MKIAIIGGGISGLSVAQMLKERHDVQVFESSDRPGGIVKCDNVEGALFHRTGGHVFNTKRKDVLEWFWNRFDREEEFTKAIRNSVISMTDGKEIPYPIENHAYLLDDIELQSVISDLLTLIKRENIEPTNFEEFLQQRFGETLYQLYFRPYNYKVWRRDLSKIPLSWLEGKLPMPTVGEILYNNIRQVKEQSFVHSSFYYPKRGGSQFIVNRLAQGLVIACHTPVGQIERRGNRWKIGDLIFDAVVFCGNIKQLPTLLGTSLIESFEKDIELLESHGTTTAFCEIEQNPYSWIYLPSHLHESHRIICTGNFSPNNNALGKMTATIEFTDYLSKEEIMDNLKRIPYAPHYLTHHYEQHTYPIQNIKTREMVSCLKEKLQSDNFYLCGRFAEWEYYNMDAAMGAAIDLSKKL